MSSLPVHHDLTHLLYLRWLLHLTPTVSLVEEDLEGIGGSSGRLDQTIKSRRAVAKFNLTHVSFSKYVLGQK